LLDQIQIDVPSATSARGLGDRECKRKKTIENLYPMVAKEVENEDPHFESVCCSFRGLFLEPKPLKIGSKNRSKNPRNSSKIVPKTMENLQNEARGDQIWSPNR
jgi:hypothetical protein